MDSAVAVIGCGAFVPGYAGLAGWAKGECRSDHDQPTAAIIPARQRRRTSILSKAFADAYADALQEAGLEPDSVSSVFGAALGEASTMVRLLDQMWTEGESLSPMLFATSVHNAASGAISIATGNRGITTSVGADYDTPAMALLEGIGMVHSGGGAVIVCCGDEGPPEGLIDEDVGWGLMTAAIAIGPAASAPAGSLLLVELGLKESRTSDSESGAPLILSLPVTVERDESRPVGRNPNVGLLDLAVTLHQGREGWIRLDRGAGRGFGVRILSASP